MSMDLDRAVELSSANDSMHEASIRSLERRVVAIERKLGIITPVNIAQIIHAKELIRNGENVEAYQVLVQICKDLMPEQRNK